MLIEDTVTLPIQINGKRRSEITVAKDATKEEVEKIALADDAASADMVIELLSEREQRRSASVSGTARVTQYEMTYGVRYRVTDGKGTELVPTQWVDRLEVYSVDRNNIVGSSEEQSLLQREMREDILQQILRTLAAVAPKAESAG
mgnify:CR=1 FL=1